MAFPCLLIIDYTKAHFGVKETRVMSWVGKQLKREEESTADPFPFLLHRRRRVSVGISEELNCAKLILMVSGYTL